MIPSSAALLKTIQADQLADLLSLALKSAHDLNNRLTTVIGFSELMHMNSVLPDKDKTHLEKILSSAKEARTIIAQFQEAYLKIEDGCDDPAV